MSRSRIISALSALLTLILSFTGIVSAPKDSYTFKRAGWLLEDVPAYSGGLLSYSLYDAGSGLADDSQGETEEDSYMEIIRWTDESDYNSYLDKLEYFGYTEVYENQIENNLYAEYMKDDSLVYTYYNDSISTARVIEDNSSVPITDFSYTYEPQENESAAVYQYGLYYGEDDPGVTSNCGMLYVVKLADNSVIIVDGGNGEQATDLAVNGFWDFLREITDTQDGEKLRIAAWYGTHAHFDHMAIFAKLLRIHSDEISLERVMFNYPSYSTVGYTGFTPTLRSRIKQYFPDVDYLKLHSGQSFSLADVNIEVLYTHEDNVNIILGKFTNESFNETSTIIRITFEGKTFMLLADCYKTVQSTLLNNFSGDVLKSDIVQASHHAFNNVKKLYKNIDADIALIPEERNYILANDSDVYEAIAKYTDEENIYFSASGTYGISVVDGECAVSFRELIGSESDNSEI